MPSPVGGLGACSQKKINFALKNYAILSKFWYFFPILQHKNFQRIRESGGGIISSPKSGGLIPCHPPPCSNAYEDNILFRVKLKLTQTEKITELKELLQRNN